MMKGEGETSYLTRSPQVEDEFAAISETILDFEMVCIPLKGFTPQWKLFIKGIILREKLQYWNRLWDDFTKEEL